METLDQLCVGTTSGLSVHTLDASGDLLSWKLAWSAKRVPPVFEISVFWLNNTCIDLLRLVHSAYPHPLRILPPPLRYASLSVHQSWPLNLFRQRNMSAYIR